MKQNNLLHKSSNISYDKGFIYVASLNPIYYEFAINSAETLRAYDKRANITLFTHEKWVDNRALSLFDEIRVGIPCSRRAKMWAMARSPYSVTVYNDADSVIRHRDVRKIYEFAKEYDILFPENALYTVAHDNVKYIDKNKTIIPFHHGAMCVYRSSDKTLQFHQTWYDEYIKRLNEPWEYEDWSHSMWKQFDMFTLWTLINNFENKYYQFKDLKFGLLNFRWSNTFLHDPNELEAPPVITQYNKTMAKDLKYFYDSIKSNIKKYNKVAVKEDHTEYS